MSKTPGVILEKSGGQVRLRGQKYPLPVTLDTEKKGRISVTIQPNRWTKVPQEIYEFLEKRFDTERFTAVPDLEENENRPHAPGAQPIMTTEQVDPGFFLEFRS